MHKASSGAGTDGKPRQEGAGADDAAKVSAEDGTEGDGENGKGAELDDDDDVGFRVTFVSGDRSGGCGGGAVCFAL